jgi:Lrp/AsnC family transcriptional regulator, regulator for asnA, asnC and gidA
MDVWMTNLDLTDRCVITLLQVDGRLSHTEIARRLGIPEATVRRRMRRLLDEGTIQIVAHPEPYQIGYGVHAIIGLRVQPGKVMDVLAILRPLRQVRYVGATAGTYDIVIETFFRDNDELREFLMVTLGQIPGLQSTETSYLLQIAKRSYKIDLLPTDDRPGRAGDATDEADLLRRCWAAVKDLEEHTNGHGEAEPE